VRPLTARSSSLPAATLLALVGVVAVSVALAGCRSESIDVEEPRGTDLPSDTFHSTAFEDEFPLQFDSYLSNVQVEDYISKLTVEVEPDLPILWSNLAFSKSYNYPRGHTYGLEDVLATPRIGDASIGSCMTCKSTAVPTLLEEFGDDYWSASFNEDLRPRVVELAEEGQDERLGEFGHMAIGCSDCHDPQTMDLRITRPSLLEALERQGVDILEASKNDMRALVCAQCHVEYYFDADTKQVTFPWDRGLRPEDMWEYKEQEAYEAGFEADWIHGVSGAPMLKAQHPEYELWSHGTHGEAGVTCADCHMPYLRVDGRKISQHFWGSPLEDTEQSCRTCHADRTASQLRQRVYDIQERHLSAMEETQERSVQAHYYVNRLITAGADEETIEEAQHLVRKGQWFWDIIAAENSDGFHNPHGSMDAMRESSDASNEAVRIATAELVRLGVDLDELDEMIEQTRAEVWEESDPLEKAELATNDYFPFQG
jgi:nitrite reductase (cytochrome c-552)